jgi:hypothetical protein
MKKLFATLIIILAFSFPVWAQQAPPADSPKPATTTLTPDESKALKQAFDLAGQAEAEAKAAQDRLAARQAEAKALYWQFIVLKKIDIDKWQFTGFDEKGIAVFSIKTAIDKKDPHNGK